MLDIAELPNKDMSNHRVITLDNGNKIHCVRNDPYGFWTIHYDKGMLPDRLTGHYTSMEAARKDLECYLIEKKRTIEKIKD